MNVDVGVSETVPGGVAVYVDVGLGSAVAVNVDVAFGVALGGGTSVGLMGGEVDVFVAVAERVVDGVGVAAGRE